MKRSPKATPKVVVAAFGDTHTNLTVGLCAPEVAEDDGGTRKFSKTQRWLHSCWSDFVGCVKQAAVGGAKIWSVGVGDLGDVDGKFRGSQYISHNLATIKKMVVRTLSPITDISDRDFLCRGTAVHDGDSSWLEELIGEDIGAEKQDGNYSSWEWEILAAGVLWNFSHHARGNGSSISSVGAAQRISRGMILQRAKQGKKFPIVNVRGHTHFYDDSFELEPCRTILMPAWTTIPEYGYRYSNGVIRLADIGGVIGVCQNGKVEITVKRYPTPQAQVWTE
jgi:hypothetical protein